MDAHPWAYFANRPHARPAPGWVREREVALAPTTAEEDTMPVLVIAETGDTTGEIYDKLAGTLAERLRLAPGFISHVAGPVKDGWRVSELWESGETANDFFAREVHPNIPPGFKIHRTVHKLHNLIRP
jgi:hypothetical protein